MVMFGAIKNVTVGQLFDTRRALAAAGVHTPLEAGIAGQQDSGAQSIVVSGRYEDDLDLGDIIIYTGFGGRDPHTGNQIADQQLLGGNLALALNCTKGLPLRVVRGASGEPSYSPPEGYRYDGLYYVERYWSAPGKAGFLVWRYRLVRNDGPPMDHARRATSTIQRIIRNTAVTERVKRLHGYRCQVCGVAVATFAGLYAEGAHIRPLGTPHDGPDTAANVLCLCPNHHVQLDTGGIVILSDMRILCVQDWGSVGSLRIIEGHYVDPTFLEYHRNLYRRE